MVHEKGKPTTDNRFLRRMIRHMQERMDVALTVAKAIGRDIVTADEARALLTQG